MRTTRILSFLAFVIATLSLATRLTDKTPPEKVEIGSAPKACYYDRPLADLIAGALYTEAAGEGVYGKYLVASVIWNRAGGDPAKLKQVITKRKQFSFQRSVTDDPASQQAWADCELTAEQLVRGTFVPLTKATHFYSGRPPYWAASMEITEIEGGHTFLREKQLRKQ